MTPKLSGGSGEILLVGDETADELESLKIRLLQDIDEVDARLREAARLKERLEKSNAEWRAGMMDRS